MFPKMLSMTLVILGLTAVSLFLVLQGIFGVPIKGSITLFFAVTALYVFTTSALGLLVATFARNLAQASLLIVLVVAPMIFLSGAWTPPEAMPDWVRRLMAISPLHFYTDASYGILLRGATAEMLRPELTGIAGLGCVDLLLGLWRFRRQFS